MITTPVRSRCRSWACSLRPPQRPLEDAEARLRNRAGAMGCALRSNAFVRGYRAGARLAPDIKPAQNAALLGAQKSLRLVGAKPTVRIT
jgi:hypothetical protein